MPSFYHFTFDSYPEVPVLRDAPTQRVYCLADLADLAVG